MDLIPDIYFEKQESNLCAQHALNVLLQGNYFTAVDLAEIARQLDREEQSVGGRKSGSESQNYDDSGYFSIQVLQKALEIWNLELIPWKSKTMDEARKNPVEQNGFICNLRNHWFTLRKFSKIYRWYNLDSTQQQGATYLGENYLSLMLDQIEREGYSVFVVKGNLPTCKADQRAQVLGRPQAQEQNTKPTFTAFTGQGYSLSSNAPLQTEEEEDEEVMLARAIQVSLEDSKPANDMDEIRRKRLARFGA